MRLYPEFEDRYAGRYFGKYRAIVVDTADPEMLGRVSVKVPVVLGSEETGWALPAPPIGGRTNVGDFRCPKKGDYVWVEFEEGDPARPIWMAGPWALRPEGSQMPLHSKGSGDLTDYSYRNFGILPPTQFEGTYGNVRYIGNDDGSFLEFDSTSGSERVQLSHRTGTRVEMTSDGSLQEAILGQKFQRIQDNHQVEIGGNEVIFVNGLRSATYKERVSETYYAESERVYLSLLEEGKVYAGTWGGDYSISSGGRFIASSQSNMFLTSGNQVSMMSGAAMAINSIEQIEVIASRATTGVASAPPNPSAISVFIHGYNGSTIVKSTDITGVAMGSILELSATSIPYASIRCESTHVPPIPLAEIKIVGSPVPLILLGGDSAVDPIVKFTELSSLLTTLITAFSTHTHTVDSTKFVTLLPLITPTAPEIANTVSTLATCASTLAMVKA